jgi:hypothetical protein
MSESLPRIGQTRMNGKPTCEQGEKLNEVPDLRQHTGHYHDRFAV